MKAKVVDLDLIQFLQYTRAGTYDLLRLEAFEILVDFDIFLCDIQSNIPSIIKVFNSLLISCGYYRKQY